MLSLLRIKNLALVNDLTLELEPGFNVITGETGAGKSILIGGLGLVLGERAERALLRSGAETCSVEAVFDVGRLKTRISALLETNGLEPCEGRQLVLKRSFSSSGANRQFINGSPTTLAVLAELGEWLVDIHGPHEHQSLLHPARQLAILDAFGKLETERDGFAALVRRRAELLAELAGLALDPQTYQQQLDLVRFQVKEITAAAIQLPADEQLEPEYRRAGNAAKLLQLSHSALDLLSEQDTSLLTQAGLLGRTLQELQRVDSGAAALLELHAQGLASLRELHDAVVRYAERVELDPARLLELEERLNLLQGLKRKYGATLEKVMAFGVEAAQKLESLEQRQIQIARLDGAARTLETELWRAGHALTEHRRKLIPPLARSVREQLSALGFQQSQFDVRLTSAEPEAGDDAGLRMTSLGLDTVEFLFAPNPGEPPRPLRAIASSGELARVMLALKTVLATADQVPVLVFDEVDANVGGETGRVVAEKMQQLARARQVLCVTHLPQVAAPADVHFVATKQVEAGRSISTITRLNKSGRITELTRMLGGQTAAARKHAEALFDSANS
ncbi:MAG TPA: DNA repair protein RecN [Verrucomicrobiae bacterium]|nr:DNA repair protein RecN [Verrucomicrobiae bacterium]